ncbi:MAG TPA: S8/S53 family peptidase [Candidatus Eisenbacteria bacterium]|nr:S8/S53 family peptidase [Candidatus Eisenbacteria bacterium]
MRGWLAMKAGFVLLSGLALVGCKHFVAHNDPSIARWEAPYSKPTSGYVGNDQDHGPPLRGQYGWTNSRQPPVKPERSPIDSSCRVHPALQNFLTHSDAIPETLLVTFRDTVSIPFFPKPNVGFSRGSPPNMALLGQADSMIQDIRLRRSAQATEDTTFLVSLGARVLESYWLIEGFQVAVPLSPGKVESLLANPNVRKLEPRSFESLLPTCTISAPTSGNATDVLMGRQEIRADYYTSPGADVSWIGLVDTGVRSDHLVLAGDPPVDPPPLTARDCINGGSNCDGNKPEDEEEGHGTSSAGVLAGFAEPDGRLRGVTQSLLDSYKVYYNRGRKWYLDVCATVRGIQFGVSRLNRVLVIETQDPAPATCATLGGIGEAADRAFDTGVLVVAAAGNFGTGCTAGPTATSTGIPCTKKPGTGSSIGVPASSRRVFGIGSYDLETKCCEMSQSWNTTSDGRIKPDMQLPTITRTAGNRDDCTLQSYTGTSAATAYAGGALALLRNVGSTYDAGQVYALAILSGESDGPPFAERGAGRMKLPWDDHLTYTKVSLNANEYYDLYIEVPATGIRQFRAAIWWPEYLVTSGATVVNSHNNIDLQLLDRSGAVVKSSTSVGGVFERLTWPSITNGPWKLRIKATTIRNGPQTVYCSTASKY